MLNSVQSQSMTTNTKDLKYSQYETLEFLDKLTSRLPWMHECVSYNDVSPGDTISKLSSRAVQSALAVSTAEVLSSALFKHIDIGTYGLNSWCE